MHYGELKNREESSYTSARAHCITMHASTWFNKAQVDRVRVVPFEGANPAVVGSSVTFRHVPYKEREVNFKRLLFLKILKV